MEDGYSRGLRDAWLERIASEGNLSDRDLDLLSRASAVLCDNVLALGPWGDERGICPSPANYRGVWNWDAAFHALAVSRFDPVLAYEQFRIFFHGQTENGLFPDVIRCDGSRMDNYSKPPVFPWAFVKVYERAPDRDMLTLAYDHYCRNAQFWENERMDPAWGMFHYDVKRIDDRWLTHVKWESGQDTSPRWDEKIIEYLAVELNAYMVLFYDALAFMAGKLGLGDEQKGWWVKNEDLKGRITEKLWDPERRIFADRDRFDKTFSPHLSPASFAPLYAGAATAEQAADLVKAAADPALFFPGMPSIAYNDPAFDPADYWRGPTWLNITYFAIEGLKRYGYADLAEHFRQTVLDWADREKRGIFEYYNARTGEGLGAPHFGWSSAFIIEMILG